MINNSAKNLDLGNLPRYIDVINLKKNSNSDNNLPVEDNFVPLKKELGMSSIFKGNVISPEKIEIKKIKISKEGMRNLNYSLALSDSGKYADVSAEKIPGANYMDTIASRYSSVLSEIKEKYGDVPGIYKKHVESLDNVFKNAMNSEANSAASKITFTENYAEVPVVIWEEKTITDIRGNEIKINVPKPNDSASGNETAVRNAVADDLKSINSKFIELFKEYINDNGFEDALKLAKSELSKSLSPAETETMLKLENLS